MFVAGLVYHSTISTSHAYNNCLLTYIYHSCCGLKILFPCVIPSNRQQKKQQLLYHEETFSTQNFFFAYKIGRDAQTILA